MYIFTLGAGQIFFPKKQKKMERKRKMELRSSSEYDIIFLYLIEKTKILGASNFEDTARTR